MKTGLETFLYMDLSRLHRMADEMQRVAAPGGQRDRRWYYAACFLTSLVRLERDRRMFEVLVELDRNGEVA